MEIWGIVLTAVGAAAAVATLVLVALERAERGRRARGVILSFRLTANRMTDDELAAHVVELGNAGVSSAVIVSMILVGAKTVSKDNPHPPKTLVAHSSFSFFLEPTDPKQVWLFVAWLDVENATRVFAEWMPLDLTNGPLEERYEQQSADARALRRWHLRRRRAWRRLTIGPEGRPWGLIARSRRGPSEDERTRLISEAVTALQEGRAQSLR